MADGRDTELVARAIDGDDRAFGELVEMLKGTVYQVAYAHLRNEDEALDVVQDTFLKAYTRLEQFRAGSNFKAWVCRIAANGSIDRIRRRKTWKKAEINERLDQSSFNEGKTPAVGSFGRASPVDEAARMELGSRLMAALDTLPEQQRQCVILCDIHGYSYQEIAETMEIPKGTVMSRLFYARKKLQKELSEFAEEVRRV